MYTKITLITVLLTSVLLNACNILSPYASVVIKNEKNKFDQASFTLGKIKSESTYSLIQSYTYTSHFKNPLSPFQNIDSAIIWAFRGDTLWDNGKKWEKQFILKRENSALPFKKLIRSVDSLGFEEAVKNGTEKSFNHYLSHFPNPNFQELAIVKRDSVAFQNARAENTFLAYKHFLEKYPDSKQADQAQEIYDLLLYETHTRDQSLKSFENFVNKFPHSPYLKQAEHKLFELFTLDHQSESFERFIKSYPNSFKTDEAKLWLKHLIKKSDSIQTLFTFPHRENSKNILVNPYKGEMTLFFDSIRNHSLCEPLRSSEIIYLNDNKWGMADSEGFGIIPAIFLNLERLEDDILVYTNDQGKGIIHNSGFIISRAIYDSIEVLNDTFLITHLQSKKGLSAYNGKELSPIIFDEIQLFGKDKLTFRKENKWAIARGSDFLNWPDVPKLKFEINNVEKIFNNLYVIEDSSGKYLVNPSFKEKPTESFTDYKIIKDFIVAFKPVTNALFNKHGKQLVEWTKDEISVNDLGYFIKTDSNYSGFMFGRSVQQIDSFEIFSPYYVKLFTIGKTLIMTKSEMIDISNYEALRLAFYQQNEIDTFCFVVVQNNKHGLISAIGDTIIPLRFEEIVLYDIHAIRIKLQDKYGLMNLEGKEILKPEFQAITNYEAGSLLLLKNKKYGLINPGKSIFYKANQRSSIKLTGLKGGIFVRSSDQNQGIELFDTHDKVILKADSYQEINDSLLFINQNFRWNLYEIKPDKSIANLELSCLKYSIWTNDQGQKGIIYETETGAGFYDLQSKNRLYPEYFDIVPINDKVGKLYVFMAFKYYEEINLYLFKILDKNGEELYKTLISEDKALKMDCSGL